MWGALLIIVPINSLKIKIFQFSIFSFLFFDYLCGLFNQKNFIEMPKMKTNAGAKKRFDFTGTGKIKRKHAYHSHILTKKSTKRKRNLDYSAIVTPADAAKLRKLLVK